MFADRDCFKPDTQGYLYQSRLRFFSTLQNKKQPIAASTVTSIFLNLVENFTMSIEQIVDVPANGQLTIQLPDYLQNRKKVKLIINDIDDTLESKISLLKKASRDKDFLHDLQEVNNDFEFAESNIEE